MKRRATTLWFYGSLIVVSLGVIWAIAPWIMALFSPMPVGAGLVAVFAALYIGELKQESISQLYQALASANLRSAAHARFSAQSLEKVRVIRRLFLLSNITKLLGALPAIYLLNEKTATSLDLIAATRFSLGMLALSLILFARLWAEVSFTEALLMAVKQESLVQARRDAFQASSRAALPHDFDSDPAAKSFESDLKSPLQMSALQ